MCPLKNKTISKTKLETAFLELLARVTPTEAFLNYFAHVVLTHWNSRLDTLKAAAKSHEDALTELETRRKNIFEMRENGSYTQEMFRERMSEVENLIMVEKIALGETNIDKYDIETDIEYAKQSIRDISRQWFDIAPTLRARFQKIIFPLGIAFDREKGFGTVKLGRIYTLNQEQPVPNSALVDPTGLEPATPSLQMRCSTR